MKWHDAKKDPLPDDRMFIAAFEMNSVRENVSVDDLQMCLVYVHDEDGELVDAWNEVDCGLDAKEVCYWADVEFPDLKSRSNFV